MIEISEYRLRWDGSYNWVVEKRQRDKEGELKFDKQDRQMYTGQTYHGAQLSSAVSRLCSRLIEDGYESGEVSDLKQLEELVRGSIAVVECNVLNKMEELLQNVAG